MQVDLMDNVSIIIRNRNESEFIGFALQSCLDYFNNPEIIIVDNNSTDDSLEIVNLFIDRANIKIVNIYQFVPKHLQIVPVINEDQHQPSDNNQ